MPAHFTESSYEESIIELFEGMDYRYVYGPELERDYMNPLYVEDFEDSIYRITREKIEKLSRMPFIE